MAILNKFFLLCPRTAAEKSALIELNPNFLYETNDYLLYANDGSFKIIDGIGVFINGYVLPRIELYQSYKSLNQHQLIAKVYEKYGQMGCDYIKGIFIIIIFDKLNIHVVTDHLGLNKAFYSISHGGLYLSNSIKYLKKIGIKIAFDEISLLTQSLFHRVPSKSTIFNDIFKTSGGALISVFGERINIASYFNAECLLSKRGNVCDVSYFDFADNFRDNLSNFNEYLRPAENFLTITGGKDSRTILTALLNIGILPKGFTYGNKNSRDAIFARNVANAVGLTHYTISPNINKGWIEDQARRIVELGNPEINIHRSHRLFSFSELEKKSGSDAGCYTGYLGGELLMGIYPDNLIFTNFLTHFWKTGKISGMPELFKEYFNKVSSSAISKILERFNELKCMNSDLSSYMQTFYGIFEIGILHHYQDVKLANTLFKYPYPVFLDIDFLDLLFTSRYSFLDSNNANKNLLKRYHLYELSMNMQHILFPALDELPFGKKGSYNISEYLKGPVQWSIIKLFRYLTETKKYPAPFVYGTAYVAFLRDHLRSAITDKTSIINDLFMTRIALEKLDDSNSLSSERQFHKYSNIVMFYLIEKALKNED